MFFLFGLWKNRKFATENKKQERKRKFSKRSKETEKRKQERKQSLETRKFGDTKEKVKK